jgi:FkbM family methyltransferase
MYKTVNTDFGPIVAVATDIRILPSLEKDGHWELPYLQDFIATFTDTIRDGDVIVDAGCNIGTWTLPLAKQFPNNRIIAVDCQQAMTDALKETVKLNNLTNVEVITAALGAEESMLLVNAIDYECGANFGSYELNQPYCNSDSNVRNLDTTVEIKQITLDSLELSNVTAIKLDIEGYELAALQGATTLLATQGPVVYFENTKIDSDRAVTMLDRLNYLVKQEMHITGVKR